MLYQLRRQLMDREITFHEARRALVELEAALEKVTAPANRVGVFLGSPKTGIATVFVGVEHAENGRAAQGGTGAAEGSTCPFLHEGVRAGCGGEHGA